MVQKRNRPAQIVIDKANVLASFFSSVFTDEPPGDLPEPNPVKEEAQNFSITEDLVIILLLDLITGKATGPNGLHPFMLKSLANELKTPISIIFNKSIERGQIPEAWKVGSMIMIALPYNLGNLSGLGLLWTSLSGAYVAKGLIQMVAGSGTSRDFDGQKGILRFQKRPIQRLFLGLSMSGAVCIAAYNSYCFSIADFNWLASIIERMASPKVVTTDEMSTLIGGSLLFIHTFVRLYRSIYVNVFGSTTQDLLDWMAPHLYSVFAGVTILSEAPALDGSGFGWFSWSSFNLRHLIGTGLFFFISYQDSKLQLQLAKFRKNRAGHVVSEDHKQPKGGAFEYISSPQMLSEILSNAAIGVTLGFGHRTWWCCTSYVAVSQIFRAVGRQQWYRKKFESFPKNRKAIIPFIL